MSERSILAAAALAAALALGAWGSRPPAPLPESAPQAEFSAGRAMADVREIARAPHPTGSAESARVVGYLRDRMRELGLEVDTQVGPLHDRARERLRNWGMDPQGIRATNVIGVLPGRNRAAPAVLVMAHHDTWVGSPGAADDTAGVATALEVARALRASGPPARDVAFVITDAEELGLVGATNFFTDHPLRERIGGVVNLDTRGGGGRTIMYETSSDNAALIDVYRRVVRHPATSSLGVLVYRLMPNRTDLTVALQRGEQGYNLAFIGRPGHYHTVLSTPDRLDRGALQHMGSQALDLVRALAEMRGVPEVNRNAVFADVYGLAVIAYPPAVGWAVLLASAGLLAFAVRRGRPGVLAVAGGAATGVAVALLVALAAQVAAAAVVGGLDYYGELAGMPRLEAVAGALGLAVLAAAAAGHVRTIAAGAALPAAWLGWWLGGPAALLFGLAVGAVVAGILSPRRFAGVGVLLPLLALATVAQVLAPEATPPLAWPLLAGALVAALAALGGRAAGIAAAVLAAAAGGWVLVVGHLVFLGVGGLLPAAVGLFGLLLAALLAPLVTDGGPTDVRHRQPSTSVTSTGQAP